MNFIIKFILFYLSTLNNHNNFNSKIYIRKAKMRINENLIEISNFMIFSLIENSKFNFLIKSSNSFFIENLDDIYEFINIKENSIENKLILFENLTILNEFFSMYKYCYNDNKEYKNKLNIIINKKIKFFNEKNEISNEKIKKNYELIKNNEINFLFEISNKNFNFLVKNIKNKKNLILINNISIEINKKNYPSKFYIKITKIFFFLTGIFLIIFHKSKERLNFNNILSTQILIEILLILIFIINFIEYLNVEYYENISKINFYSEENLKNFKNFNNFNIFINFCFIFIKNSFFFIFYFISIGFDILFKEIKNRKKIFFSFIFCDFFIQIFLWFFFYEQKILFNFSIIDFYLIIQNLFFIFYCLFHSKNIINFILNKIEILRNFNINNNIFEEEINENFLINVLNIESYLKKSFFISGNNIINFIYNFFNILFIFIINFFLFEFSNDINKFISIIINNFSILFLSILFFPKDLPDFYWIDEENSNEIEKLFKRKFKVNINKIKDLREINLNEIYKNYDENQSENNNKFPIVIINPFDNEKNIENNNINEYQNLLNDENAINNSFLTEENNNNNNKLINKSIENMKIGFLFNEEEDNKKNIYNNNNNNNNEINIDEIFLQYLNHLNFGED